MAKVVDAPSYQTARENLADVLGQWTFAVMVQQCPFPPNCIATKPDGSVHITHFQGTAEEMDPTSRSHHTHQQQRHARIWFKKSARMRDPLRLGPALIPADDQNRLPMLGDVLVGSKTESGATGGGPGVGARAARYAFIWWHSGGKPLAKLTQLVLQGTSQLELRLAAELRTPDGYDDLWAMARVILFGNVQGLAVMAPDAPISLTTVNVGPRRPD